MIRSFLSFAVVALVISVGGVAHAQSVTLAWDPNPEADLSGYVVAYGTASGQLTKTVSVGKATQTTIDGLTVGKTYFFAVRAYNTLGLASPLSVELSTTVVAPPPTSRSDLLLRNTTTGAIARWILDGTKQIGGDSVGPGVVADLGWKVAGMGNFNGDSDTDIIWQHDDGRLSAWLMRGSSLLDGRLLTPAQVDPAWRIAATADVDGDGRTDLLWQHQTQGYVAVWYMNGTSLRSGALLEPGQVSVLDWKIVGAGDFDGDRDPDLLWHHATTGNLAVWLMNGTRLVEGRALSPGAVSDLDWKVVALTDVNDDKKADIIWEHADGRVAVWVMKGTTLGSGLLLTPSTIPGAWDIVSGR